MLNDLQISKLLQRLYDHLPLPNGSTEQSVSHAEVGSPSSKLRSDLDLNGVAEDELEEYKRLMDEKFNENRVRPGDADYEYDKRVRPSFRCSCRPFSFLSQQEFAPVESSEWDDE